MKNLLSLFVLISFGFPLQAQINPEDSTVQAIAYWDNHDTMDYVLTKLQIEAHDSTLDTISKTVYKLTMTVEDSTETSYTVNWQYYLLEMVNNGKRMPIPLSVRKFTDFKLVIKTDEFGAFETIENSENLEEQIGKLMQIQMMAKTDMDAATQHAKKLWDKKMADHHVAELLLKEVPMYFRYYGYKYRLMQPLTDTVETDLFLGDQKARVEMTNWLKSIDFNDDTYILLTQQSMDAETIKKIYVGMREMYDPNYDPGEPVDEALLKDFIMEDNMGAILHGPTGWIVRFEFIREVSSSPDLTKYDEIYFEME